MTTRKVRDVTSSLVKKGFERSEGDHVFFTYYRTGDQKKTAVFTKVSHGEVEVDDFLLGKMAQQCKLTKADFLALVDCPMARADYEARLRSRGVDV